MFKHRLAGAHPVAVAEQRVDLPVVRHQPEGLSQAPTGGCVGAETLVEERRRRNKVGVFEVSVERCQLGGGQQPFVDDVARGERGDIAIPDAGLRQPALDLLAHQVEVLLKLALAPGGDGGLGL